MKKIFLVTISVLSLLVFTSCVKQDNCDCGLSTVRGKFVYFENGKKITYCDQEKTVNAVVFQDTTEVAFFIIGTIPKKYHVTDTVFTITCLEEVPKELCWGVGVSRIFRLKCIEEHP